MYLSWPHSLKRLHPRPCTRYSCTSLPLYCLGHVAPLTCISCTPVQAISLHQLYTLFMPDLWKGCTPCTGHIPASVTPPFRPHPSRGSTIIQAIPLHQLHPIFAWPLKGIHSCTGNIHAPVAPHLGQTPQGDAPLYRLYPRTSCTPFRSHSSCGCRCPVQAIPLHQLHPI